MKNKPFLSKIRLYPVKSLDPIEVTEAEVGIRSLLYDREFAMVTKDWRYVNGKRTGRVNELKTEFLKLKYQSYKEPKVNLWICQERVA